MKRNTISPWDDKIFGRPTYAKSSGALVKFRKSPSTLDSMLNRISSSVAQSTKSNISCKVEILVPGRVSWNGNSFRRREPQSSVLIWANVRLAMYCGQTDKPGYEGHLRPGRTLPT